MAVTVQDGGVSRVVVGCFVHHAGAVRQIQRIRYFDGVDLKVVAVFAPPLTVSATPESVSGTVSSFVPTLISTTYTTAAPAGGTAPYSYSWALVSGDGTVAAPSSATTNFSATVNYDDAKTGLFRITVTDAFGFVATDDVTATFTNAGSGGF